MGDVPIATESTQDAGVVFSLDNRLSLAGGRLHLAFEIGRKRIAYAYIRKNGCSSFKRALGYAASTSIDEIAPHHRFKAGRYDATIFVWRDPMERVVSLYKNKILDRDNAADLLSSYQVSMGEEPSSFEKFVEFVCLEKDPHCWTQRSHLARLCYTHAIPLSGLHRAMCDIVGVSAAEPFALKTNASRHHEVEVTARAAAMIRRHYASDYDLVRRICSRRGGSPWQWFR